VIFCLWLNKVISPSSVSYLESNSLSCLHQCFSSCFQPYSSLFISDPLIPSPIAAPLYRFTALAVLLSSFFCTPGLLHNFHKYPGPTFRTITRTVSSEQELSGLVFHFLFAFCFCVSVLYIKLTFSAFRCTYNVENNTIRIRLRYD